MIQHRLIAVIVCGLLIASPAVRANLICTTGYQFSASMNSGSSGNVLETISTTPGELYQISFEGYISSLYTPTILNVSFGDGLNQSLVGDLGHQYYLWYFGQAGSSVVSFNYLVPANSEATTLAFQYSMTSEDYGMTIRNLSVNLVPDATSTAALLSVAGVGLVFMRRRLGSSR